MSLGEHFPACAKAFPKLLSWQSPFDWIMQGQFLAEAVFELQLELQKSGDQLNEFCEALRADVEAETIVQSDPAAAAMIDGFRFVTSQVQIYRTMTSGRLGTCYHWLLWSISREHVFGRTENRAEYRLPPYASATKAMNELALEVAVDWAWAAYIVAHKFGGLDGHCSDFLEASLAIGRRAGSGKGVQALTAIAVYSAAKKLGSTRAQVDALLECLNHPEVPTADKARFKSRCRQTSVTTPTLILPNGRVAPFVICDTN